MILRGRLTVYGEYLMKTRTRGLIVPTELCLATADEIDQPVHPDYDPARDRVAQWLRRQHIAPEQALVRGDLPFGFGLASSTALTFVHTARGRTRAEAAALSRGCDREIHGFEPSGMDAAAISHQADGFFSTQGWEPVQRPALRYTLVFLPAERRHSLADVETRIGASAEALSRIADALTSGLVRHAVLDYALLLDYALALAATGVYSSGAQSFVTPLLARGVVAKAIGGLYDKAILIVWPDAAAPARHQDLLIDRRCSAVVTR